MTTTAAKYYASIPDSSVLNNGQRIEYFVYYLTEVLGLSVAKSRDIEECFRECDLHVPGSVSGYLSTGLKSKPRKFIKAAGGGYRLERHLRSRLHESLAGDVAIEISPELNALAERIPPGVGRDWLTEALNCFGVHAYRATMIMVWLYALDHLFHFVLAKHLSEFNAALQSHPDQRSVKKVGVITTRDQFTLLGEEMFIDLCRTAGVISPDVKRILLERLGARNSAAHPSGVIFTRHNTVGFVESLLHNVVLKYPL